jgi:hypothetical protein
VLWEKFTLESNLDPFLRTCFDPVPIIQVFAQRYRDGRIAPKGNPVRSGTVEDAVRAVGQAFTHLGALDIRKDVSGEIDFRISRLFTYYKKEDSPPSRVKPVPIIIVMFILSHANADTIIPGDCRAIADLICIAFYFLLRPREYTGTTSDDTPFRLKDVEFHVNDLALDTLRAPLSQLEADTTVSLTFTTQKNGNKGEVLTHGPSTDLWACPVRATARRVIHLRAHTVNPSTPLASYFRATRRITIKAKDVTGALRYAAVATAHQTGLHYSDISAKSLRAGGAMALRCGKIDHDTIRMLGRWHSDTMMRYLHLQEKPLMREFAPTMFNHGRHRPHRRVFFRPFPFPFQHPSIPQSKTKTKNKQTHIHPHFVLSTAMPPPKNSWLWFEAARHVLGSAVPAHMCRPAHPTPAHCLGGTGDGT